MNIRRSLFALLLALVLPLVAACGGSSTSTTTEAPSAAATGATAAPATEATAAPAETAAPATEATAAPAETAASATEATAAATSDAAMSSGTGATAGASGDITKIAVEDGAEITIVVNGNPTEQKLYQDGVARFQKLMPNVKVNVQVNNDQYETNMKAAFSAGTAPDVLLLPPQLLGAFGPEGLLLPLDEAMAEAGVQKSDCVDSLINLFTDNNETLGVPKDFNPLVVFINEDMAQKAGVDPTSIKTWDNLKEAAKKMTSGDGASKNLWHVPQPGHPAVWRGGAAKRQPHGAGQQGRVQPGHWRCRDRLLV